MNFNEVRKGEEARRGTEGLNNERGGEETSFSSLFTLCGAAMYVYGPPSARAEFGGFYDQQLAVSALTWLSSQIILHNYRLPRSLKNSM